MNSRQKGAGGERELSHILREHGYNCRRDSGCIPQEEPGGMACHNETGRLD